MSTDFADLLRAGLGELFSAEEKGEFVRARTPFRYPDGGVVDLFVRRHDGAFTLTDLGEALGWLRTQSLSDRRSPKQQKLLQDVCQTEEVELFKGQLILRCADASRLAECVIRLGQAVVRVADVWFTTRTRAVESMTDEVADLLREREIAFDRGVKLAGRSGRDWAVDFQTRTADRSALVFVLASGSRAAARRVSEHVVAGWHDLSGMRTAAPLRFVSLFDDTADVWADEDFRLVESISDVCRWSQPDEFERLLRDAA
jgi:hypothetical protein